MAKFIWQDGTFVSKAKVEIGGNIYEVDPEEYSGATPLSASNLNAMQDGIYDDIDEINEKIVDRYSTDEIKTNKVWVDGKPIYRKVFIRENIANNDNEDIALTFDSIISLDGIVEWNNSTTKHPLTWISAFISTATERSDITTGTNNIRFRNRTGQTVKINVIVEYTKTTD